jgi:hypothetical protein
VSYARFGKDSDVYVFLSVEGPLECCACALEPESECFDSTDAMLAHLREHVDAGHKVPDRTFARLEENRDASDAYIRESVTAKTRQS